MTDLAYPLPMTFEPIYKEKIWGGKALKKILNKDIPENAPIGESWEISSFKDNLSRLKSTRYPPATLPDLVASYGRRILGENVKEHSFPLLFKFIDSNEKLSIQVHPDDSQARQNGWGQNGKTEAWYIAGAKPGAQVIAGFNTDVNEKQIRKAIKECRLESLLNHIDVQKGDLIFIPSATVHTILEGVLLFETQQSSDTTFRLYDWGRVSKNGVSRPLHIDQSIKVLNMSASGGYKIPPLWCGDISGVEHWYRVACRYFAIEEFLFKKNCSFKLSAKKSFRAAVLLDGEGKIICGRSALTLAKGESALIPAHCSEPELYGEPGMHILVAWVPELDNEIIGALREKGFSKKRIISLGGPPGKNDILPLI